MDLILERLAGLPLADWIRASAWAFPIINTGHVFGLALLFGSIVAVDLRLVGLGRRIGVDQLATVLLPVAVTGFAVAILTGGLMFLADPRQYWHNTYFPWKLGLIVAAGINAAWLHSTCWRSVAHWGKRTPFSAKLAGLASILLWSGVITCGRLMAYF